MKRTKETNVKKPRKSRKGIIIGIITIAILAIMIPLGMYFTSGAKEVSIPKIVGLSQDEAKSVLKKLGLTMEVDSTKYDENYKEGCIISSNPAEGTTVKTERYRTNRAKPTIERQKRGRKSGNRKPSRNRKTCI